MKKQRKLKLAVNKVSVSKLNSVKGGNPIISIDVFCAYTENEVECTSDPCQTGLTVLDRSVGKKC